MRFPWSVDPTRCARCGHLESLHRSRVLYPRSPDRQLARPCTRPVPHMVIEHWTTRPVMALAGRHDGCGCPDFVTPAPVWVRAANVVLDWWLVTVLTLLVMGFVISLLIKVLS